MSNRTIVSSRYLKRPNGLIAAFFLLGGLLCPAARAADDKKPKPEKEKKEKFEPWVEVRTAHFIVASDGGEKTARRFAEEFETLLRVFKSTMPKARITTGIPVRILAPRNNQSYGNALPDFPYNKNRDSPPGLFVAGPEKTFIAVRSNAAGKFAYAGIYQSYAREILKLSYRNLPPWIEEGYSTVFSSLTFTDRGARMERPEPDDLSVLFESPLLPLDLVLHVDKTSGYYSPGNKDSVYFAESRVLLHFLITDPQFAGSNALDRYLTAVQGGTDSLQAARDAFGDLNQLQAKLEAYVKDVSGPPVELSPAGGGDSVNAVRTLTQPEYEARMADFLTLRNRAEDAEDKLEEALMSQPMLAEAEQSLGFLMLNRQNFDDAQTHFEKAAQLDPSDALNFYGEGLIAMGNAGKDPTPAGAAAAFEKSVALNADFAPAWYNLAVVYQQRDETLPKALNAAQHAASLAPGDSHYQLQVTAIQNEIAHPEQARMAAPQLRANASDRATPDKGGAAIPRITVRQPPPPPPGSSASSPPPKSSPDSSVRIENKTEPAPAPTLSTSAPPAPKATPAPSPAPAPNPTPAPAPAPAPAFSESSTVYSMVGTISDVKCTSAPQIQLTLKSQTIVMKLHADDFAKVSLKSGDSAAAAKAATCTSLRGRNARITYLFVTGKPWDAEMQTVEFRSEP